MTFNIKIMLKICGGLKQKKYREIFLKRMIDYVQFVRISRISLSFQHEQ